ncbi:MAG: 50S ribosomal protein L6 [Nitrospirae bacterium RIFOXYB2_FULL_43_5]|jgi:large subunit ribosomal protein L6|nr:MAG: 50S ribosomal protein L6 [Nitrospirae bacterium GWF2_44_13]OGW32280.1 MAG: 50S ribosomal protein L6 [Nitrospirae bacterium GWD2_44_7]OGW65929.1 MAG: 50S ribosomal protein L6 [Nitrospirae bacterium RIFOXYA2_FULL_44_9]OGW74087.1 MAG: 50S ribosomal protein L6 [Nitrospirae bacterium RIFOXYC2_FULL_44_7]OGW77229.1 MAG: 50S ribosomal protein L6 [Nitrospirae bacterium RIFOXYB2_FULL_43_5]HBG93036.1 50S ribosomal protein L6 [Nitrospiraceae bacterium]
MSRIGKKPIDIPKGVDVKIADTTVNVKGPKGELSSGFPVGVLVKVDEGKVVVERTGETKNIRALHGLTRSLISNMVSGVSSGYQRVLEITGTGYRAQVQGNKLLLALGYSHPVEFILPPGIKAAVDQKQTQITLTGIDKQQMGQIAADLRALRPPDIYKGKGVRYAGQRLKLKVGKAGKK